MAGGAAARYQSPGGIRTGEFFCLFFRLGLGEEGVVFLGVFFSVREERTQRYGDVGRLLPSMLGWPAGPALSGDGQWGGAPWVGHPSGKLLLFLL